MQNNEGSDRMEPTTVIYDNLLAEIARAGETPHSVARKIGVNCHTMYRKLRGRTDWKLWEAMRIRSVLQTALPYEILFERNDGLQ